MSEPRVQRALLFGLAGGFLAYISRMTFASPDMFHAMALFRESLSAGWILNEDVFAYTPTVRPSVHHEWGTGALLYLTTVTAGGGAAGLMLLKYALTAGIAAGCFFCARRRGASTAVIVILAPIVFPLGWVGFGTIRAQLFTLLLLVILMLLLEEDRRGRRWWVAAWLPLYVLWLNLHAGFVVGVGLFAFYTVERFARELMTTRRWSTAFRSVMHLLATGLLMFAAIWINPYGTDFIVYLWHGLRMERPAIAEWAPIWRTYQPVLTLEFFLISLGIIVYAFRKRGLGALPDLLFVVVSAMMALKHIRHGSIYAVVWLCYVPSYIQTTPLAVRIEQLVRDHGKVLYRAGWACGCLGLTIASWNHFWRIDVRSVAAPESAAYPVGAVDYLARHQFSGNVMVPFNYGAYVSWKLFPLVKVSIDSRYEAAYPEGTLEANLALYAAEPGWWETLTRYPTDAVMVRRSAPLEQAMESADAPGHDRPSGAWERVYWDDGFSLFVRHEIAKSLPVVDNSGQKMVATFP